MHKSSRTVNRKLIKSLISYNGLTLETLGASLDPPLTKSAISRLIDPKRPDYKPENRLAQISAKLHVPDPVLFPYVEPVDLNP